MPLYVELDRADIALYSDPAGTRVRIPRLQGHQRTRTFDRTRVLFEGDEHPVDFRGTGRARTYSLVARYLEAEHAEYLALIDLFETSFDAADGRLQLRSHVGLVDGLNPYEVVTVDEVSEAPAEAGTIDVTFTAYTVKYSIEV